MGAAAVTVVYAAAALTAVIIAATQPVSAACLSPSTLPTDCADALPSGATLTAVNITSGGIARSYTLFVPPSYSSSTAAPLILSFHGGTQSPFDQIHLDLLVCPYFQDEYIVVYPQGVDCYWEGSPAGTANDTLFTSDILDDLSRQYNINSSRVYATGKSEGGDMVNILACDPVLSTRFAAFAPVSGAFYVNVTGDCDPAAVAIPCNPGRSRIPILEFHGGKDTVIPYDGEERKGECLPSIPHWLQGWAARDGLSDTNTSVSLPLGGADEPLLYLYGNDTTEDLVRHVYDPTINHQWPNVCGSFLGRAATGSGLVVLAPLWRRPRPLLLAMLKGERIAPLITCMSLNQLGEDLGRRICGRILDDAIIDLLRSSRIVDGGPIDECGENGEFHTML